MSGISERLCTSQGRGSHGNSCGAGDCEASRPNRFEPSVIRELCGGSGSAGGYHSCFARSLTVEVDRRVGNDLGACPGVRTQSGSAIAVENEISLGYLEQVENPTRQKLPERHWSGKQTGD